MILTSKLHNTFEKLSQTTMLLWLFVIACIPRVLFIQHGISFHPDERHIVMVAQKLSLADPNPHSFAYGSLLFYLLKGVAYFLGWWIPSITSYDNLFLVGRMINAVLGALTVLATYKLGFELFNNKAIACLGGLLLLFNVFHLQQSHFYTSDVPLTLFCNLALLYTIRIAKSGQIKDYLKFAVCLGLALAFKIAALTLFLPLLCAHFTERLKVKGTPAISFLYLISIGIPLMWFRALPTNVTLSYLSQLACASLLLVSFMALVLNRSVSKSKSLNSLLTLMGVGLVGLGVFFVCAPYSFIDLQKFLHDIQEQLTMVAGAGDPPYTRQYRNTTPYLYHLQQMGQVSMGWLTLTCGLLGLGLFGSMWLKNYNQLSHFLPPLAWVLALFIVVAGKQVKFPRYLLPLYPCLLLFAAFFVYQLGQTILRRHSLKWAIFPSCLILLASMTRSMALLGIYTVPHTYLLASQWIYDNVPAQSRILGVHWDDKVPVELPGRTTRSYQMWGSQHELALYEPDTTNKHDTITQQLSQADYLVFPTDRLPASILQVEERYPETSTLMRQLFSGKLGYDLVQTIKLTPTFMGIRFPDVASDESFSVYDHPRVSVLKNNGKLSTAELSQVLANPTKLPSKHQVLNYIAGDNFSVDLGKGLALLIGWCITWELFGLLALPLVAFTCRSFPDHGLGLTRTLGFLLFGLLIWLLNVLGVSSTPLLVKAIFLALIAIAALLAERMYQTKALPSLSAYSRSSTLWYCFILFFLATRALHPEIHWGEKPMDFSFLNYFRRIDFLPPADPWAAGHTMSYYYFGLYIFAQLGKLTDLPNNYLFNLAIGALGAMLASCSFSALAKLTGSWRFAILGACALVITANLEMLRLCLVEFWEPLLVTLTVLGFCWGAYALMIRTKSLWGIIFSTLTIAITGRLIYTSLGALVGETISPSSHRNGFDLFWASTRVFGSYGFSEYPLWSLLFADLHAHVIAVPFTMLFMAYSLAIGDRHLTLPQRLCHSATLGLLLGCLYLLNTWDFITYSAYFCLLCLAIAILALRKFSVTSLLRQWPVFTLVPLLAFSIPLVFNLNSPTSQHLSWGWVYGDENSSIISIFQMFGLWLIVLLISSFGILNSKHLQNSPWRLACAIGLGLCPFFTQLVLYAAIALIRSTGWAVFSDLHLPPTDNYPVMIYLTCGILLFIAVQVETFHSWLALLLVLTASMVIGVETIFLIDRMNTIFKFFNAVWLLLGLASLTSLYLFLQNYSRCRSASKGMGYASITLALTIGLGFLGGIFDLITMTTHRRVPGHRPTLDGTAFLEEYKPQDASLINYLNQNIAEARTILEAHGDSYGDFGRIVMYTGLPSYIGWDHHVKQRGLPAAELSRRKKIVQQAYTSMEAENTQKLLQQESVDLVVVGELENRRYPQASLRKFFDHPELYKKLVGDDLTAVFEVAK